MVKVTVNTKNLRKKIDKAKSQVGAAIEKELRKEVLKDIKAGRSPVKGQGRFKRYSDSYRKLIKRSLGGIKKPSPVNLELTGELLDSVFTQVKNNKVTIGFKDKKFEYHNEGKGNLPVRRILPTKGGEEFNRSITLRIRELVLEKVKQIFK